MDTYVELKTQLQDLIRRSELGDVQNEFNDDIQTDYYDVAIDRAVRRVYRTRVVETQPFRATVTGTLTSGSNIIPIPNAYNMLRRITVSDGERTVQLASVDVEHLLTQPVSAQVDMPRYFGREGFSFYTQRPNKDLTYNIYYYQFLDHPSEVGTDYGPHWLLNNLGEAIMYGAGVEIAKYYGGSDLNDGRAAAWDATFNDIINEEVNRSRITEASGPSPTWIPAGNVTGGGRGRRYRG